MGDAAEPTDTIARRQLERLIFFSDAVFAIAITLLVLDLKAPEGPHGLPDLVKVLPNVYGFALSFYVIGIYWQAHHGLFGPLQAEDASLRHANLFLLATIAFLPFPTSVVTQFNASPPCAILYAASAGLTGVAQAWLAIAARRPHLLAPAERDRPARPWILRPLLTSAVFFASIPIALFSARDAMLSWLLLVPLRRLGDWSGLTRVDAARSAR